MSDLVRCGDFIQPVYVIWHKPRRIRTGPEDVDVEWENVPTTACKVMAVLEEDGERVIRHLWFSSLFHRFTDADRRYQFEDIIAWAFDIPVPNDLFVGSTK